MKAFNSIEKPGWELIGRYISGEAGPAEIKEVETWAASSEENKKELNQTRILLEETDIYFLLNKFDSTEAWKKVNRHITPAVHSSRLTTVWKNTATQFYKYAAVLLLAFLAVSAGYFIYVKNQGIPEYMEVTASERQVMNDFILPDGSVVSLNSNSRLQYPEKFNGILREVTITGEAFFEVKPDPGKPFVINAGNIRIKVMGTSFNVNAYPDAESVEVTVESGVVQVVCCEGKKPEKEVNLLLNKGEKGTLLNSNNKIEKTIHTNPNYLAWKTHNLVFEKTRLGEVVHYLEKTYRTSIQFNDKELENLLLTARFEDKSAEFILDVIRMTFDLELTQRNGVYILSKKTASN